MEEKALFQWEETRGFEKVLGTVKKNRKSKNLTVLQFQLLLAEQFKIRKSTLLHRDRYLLKSVASSKQGPDKFVKRY